MMSQILKARTAKSTEFGEIEQPSLLMSEELSKLHLLALYQHCVYWWGTCKLFWEKRQMREEMLITMNAIWAASRENLSSRFPTRSDTNRAVQPQRMVRGLNFWIYEEEGLYYQCSENKGADQVCGYRTADLRLCFRLCKKKVFSWRGSYETSYMESFCIFLLCC